MHQTMPLHSQLNLSFAMWAMLPCRVALLAALWISTLSCQSQPVSWRVSGMEDGRNIIVYNPQSQNTNSFSKYSFSSIKGRSNPFDKFEAFVFRISQDNTAFAALKITDTEPIPIRLGAELWVIQSAPHYELQIFPAVILRPFGGIISPRQIDALLDEPPGGVESTQEESYGIVNLADIIEDDHLNGSKVTESPGSFPLNNVSVDKVRIAFDVAFKKNLPVRMTFDHQFDLIKLERAGKDLEFNRKAWKRIHEAWLKSISGRLKRNQENK